MAKHPNAHTSPKKRLGMMITYLPHFRISLWASVLSTLATIPFTHHRCPTHHHSYPRSLDSFLLLRLLYSPIRLHVLHTSDHYFSLRLHFHSLYFPPTPLYF